MNPSLLALALACALVPSVAAAQHAQPDMAITASGTDRDVIWTDDFSVPGNWVTSIEPDSYEGENWEIGTGITGGNTPQVASTTASNGYAMICSDCGNNQTTVYEKCNLTTATPIDLSAYPNVTLEFQTNYRRWTNEQTYISISTDGINWPQPPWDTATVNLPPGLYLAWQPGELVDATASDNPTFKSINISAAAGGQSQVWVRFYFYGIWGYVWYVDDVTITEPPPYDLGMSSTYFSHTGMNGEYGRIPTSQLGNTLTVGGAVTNLGANPQSNVVMHVETSDAGNNVVLSHSSSAFDLGIGGYANIADDVSIPNWMPGIYHTRVWCTSNESANDANATNDTLERVLEITPVNGHYSLDGIGVDPGALVSSWGPHIGWLDQEGVVCLTAYPMQQNATVYGLEVGIGPNSVEYALLIPSIHDTVHVYPPAYDISAPFATGVEHTVTQAEIDSGSCILPLYEPFELTAGTTWLAGVEVYSADGVSPVGILNDLTHPQPYYSSCAWMPLDGATYGYGNAFAIRLILDPIIGVNERVDALVGAPYPDPADERVRIPLRTSQTVSVAELLSLNGSLVRRVLGTAKSKGHLELDVHDLPPGTYFARLQFTDASLVTCRVVVVH